jgi:hypothetical protein
VRTALDDAASIENDDRVGVGNGREAVRDNQGRPALAQAREGLLDDQLRIGIERAGGFVENQDARVLENRAGDRQPLTFPSRKPVAALPDDRVVAAGERSDDLVNLRLPRGSFDFRAGVTSFKSIPSIVTTPSAGS